jgi:hypothetical protein
LSNFAIRLHAAREKRELIRHRRRNEESSHAFSVPRRNAHPWWNSLV